MAHKKALEEQKVQEIKDDEKEVNCCLNPFYKIADALQAWILYMKYSVRNAGFGLACLYMTVLGFDNITYGYCLQQCVTESILGALVGVSALIGVSGSISFPFLRKYLGLSKTGMIGYCALIGTLTLCLISIWLEGSPFDPDYFKDVPVTNSSITNSSMEVSNRDYVVDTCPSSMISVIVLMSGIITARFGLWVSDLTITQLLQENVKEEHRGVIGGVQNGLNSAMDTIKYILVIALPEPETFAWLIIASYGFICLGAVSYTSYAIKHKHDIPVPKVKSSPTTYRSTEENAEAVRL